LRSFGNVTPCPSWSRSLEGLYKIKTYFRPVSVLIVVLSVGAYPSIKGSNLPFVCYPRILVGLFRRGNHDRASRYLLRTRLVEIVMKFKIFPCFADTSGCCVHWQWGGDRHCSRSWSMPILAPNQERRKSKNFSENRNRPPLHLTKYRSIRERRVPPLPIGVCGCDSNTHELLVGLIRRLKK
jgi:hypothetical protein